MRLSSSSSRPNLPRRNEAVLSLAFFAAFGLLFGAAKLNQRATLFTGATLNADGTAVVVAQAHPEFARQV